MRFRLKQLNTYERNEDKADDQAERGSVGCLYSPERGVHSAILGLDYLIEPELICQVFVMIEK